MDDQPVEILMVEDEVSDAILAQEALKEAKFKNNVSVVRDGEEAIRYLQQHGGYEEAPRPELILLDLNLPKVDGREVLSKVKNDPYLRQIPVIVLSTSSYEQDVQDCYDLHANCYLTKPVDFKEFRETIGLIDEFWLGLVKRPQRSGSAGE